MSLDPSTVLEIAPELDVHVRGGHVEVDTAGVRRTYSTNALAVLHAFRAPRALGEALDELGGRVKGVADWIDLTATVNHLFAGGALRLPGTAPIASKASHLVHFEGQGEHITMLDDRTRTDAFLRTIRESVRPDDVVLDIGTGSGVLAIAAAQAGARHVYAVEAGAMVEAARRMIAGNGLDDRITIVQGYSTAVTLPERATLLVTEIIGCDPFEEDALLVNWDARHRLLAPGARILPSRVRLYAFPVEVPGEIWDAEVFTPAAAARWTEWYGIGFAELTRFERPVRLLVDRPQLARWRRVGDAVLLGEVDFRECEASVRFEAELAVSEGAEHAGVATYFELPLSPNRMLSQDPQLAPATNDWPCPVWIQPSIGRLAAGERLALAYRRDGVSSLTYSRA